MSQDDQVKQLEESKNKEIESLSKMKDMLKQKLQDATKENAELKKKLDELQSQLNNVAKAEPKLQLQAQMGKSIEEKKLNVEQVQAELKGLPTRPMTPTAQGEVDVSILDKKLGAIQAKLDKAFDSIFEQLGVIIGAQKSQSAAVHDEFQDNPMVNKFANQLMKQTSPQAAENEEGEEEKPSNLMKPSSFGKKLDQMAQAQPQQPQFQQQQFQQPQQQQFQQPQFQQQQFQQPQFQQPQQQQPMKQDERPKKPSDVGSQSSGGVPESGGNVMFIDYPASGVITCPYCGKQSYQETENRSQILSYVPKIKYGKKYYCKACRKEWAYKM